MTKSKPTNLSCSLHSMIEVADWSSNPGKIERAWSVNVQDSHIDVSGESLRVVKDYIFNPKR
jgi:hypothetical protein